MGGEERNGGENCVVGRGEGEDKGDVAMEAVPAVGRDGCGICVELGLCGAEGGIRWRVGGGGDRREFEGREGGSDDTGGEGKGSHVNNYQLLLMNYINH